jgi:hypothetical protein
VAPPRGEGDLDAAVVGQALECVDQAVLAGTGQRRALGDGLFVAVDVHGVGQVGAQPPGEHERGQVVVEQDQRRPPGGVGAVVGRRVVGDGGQ